MIKVAEILPGRTRRCGISLNDCGISYVVGMMDLTKGMDGGAEDKPWSYSSLLRAQELLRQRRPGAGRAGEPAAAD